MAGLLGEAARRGAAALGAAGRRVSTRQPAGRGATEDPSLGGLLADTEAVMRNPSMPQNLDMMVQNYPGFRGLWSADPRETAQNIINHMSDNVLSLYRLSAEAGIEDRSAQWYRGANRIAGEMSERFGVTPSQAAGVLAVLSPQKDWYQNVALAERMLKHYTELTPSSKWTPSMDAHALSKAPDKAGETAWTRNADWEAVRGKPWGEMETPVQKAMWLRAYDEAHFGSQFREVSPEGEILDYVTKKDGSPSTLVHQSFADMAKAIRIMEGDGGLEQISAELGKEHKVRNFFNNIYNPDSPYDATIDTHQIAGNVLMPWGSSVPQVQHGLSGQSAPKRGMPWSNAGAAETGTGGAYGLHFDAVRQAADTEGWLPREMQSITWEQLRSLMPPTIRGNHPYVKTAEAIWGMKDRGEITADQARQMIISEAQKAGGGLRPSWVDYTGPRRTMRDGAIAGGLLGLGAAGLASASTPPPDEAYDPTGPYGDYLGAGGSRGPVVEVSNTFGDVGSRLGNEALSAGLDYLFPGGASTADALYDDPSMVARLGMYPIDVLLGGLLAAQGGVEKLVGYGSELAPGSAADERRLARDILGMGEAMMGSPSGPLGRIRGLLD